MATHVERRDPAAVTYPVSVHVQPVMENRNRLTTAFRFFLALPHLILVGGPVAVISSIDWSTDQGWNFGYGSGGALSVVACLVSFIAWFAILFTGRHPEGLWKLVAYYLRWRVHAIAYMTLLRDEYPPFGEGDYPAELGLEMPHGPRNRLTVFFRFLLALPHIFLLWLLSMVWAFTTAIAWIVILITRRYPATLYGFALGVLAWSVRVEAYLLLLRDEYPPFTLRA
jgi:hypothetical protein